MRCSLKHIQALIKLLLMPTVMRCGIESYQHMHENRGGKLRRGMKNMQRYAWTDGERNFSEQDILR